jgi:hypothetical protein
MIDRLCLDWCWDLGETLCHCLMSLWQLVTVLAFNTLWHTLMTRLLASCTLRGWCMIWVNNMLALKVVRMVYRLCVWIGIGRVHVSLCQLSLWQLFTGLAFSALRHTPLDAPNIVCSSCTILFVSTLRGWCMLDPPAKKICPVDLDVLLWACMKHGHCG